MRKSILHRLLPLGIVFLILFGIPLGISAQNVCGVKAKDIMDLLIDADMIEKSEEKENSEIINNASPYLAPNPASNIVSVSGYEGNIVDIVVMDMNGRKIALYTDVDVFDISSISSGTYIVRVRSKDKGDKVNVCYLKLIKK